MTSKNKRIILLLSVLITLAVVSTILFRIGSSEEKTVSSLEMYSLTRNDDLTYSYQIVDKKGDVLLSEDHATREPKIEQVNRHILGVTVQTGTGMSTNWAIYCDTENSKVSEAFQYVLLARDDYVIYVDNENGEHSIIVQNIFDASRYYKKHVLTDCSPVAGDIVTGADPRGDGTAVVTYFTGEDYTETELVISLPYPPA